MRFFLMVMMFSFSALAQLSPVGKWKTIDDDGVTEKSIVEIYEENGTLNGRIEKLFLKPNEDQKPKCTKCVGDMQNKDIVGMQILKGLKKDTENKWAQGQITDPNNGKTYSCWIELLENGKKLKVRGFIGASWMGLGRSQIWLQEPPL